MTIEPTQVERAFHKQGPLMTRPFEHIATIVVPSFPDLGRLTALRFIEWSQSHSDWSVALPTGRTPEHFIAWTKRLLETWDTPQTRSILEQHQIDPALKPRLDKLHFVQIDEFYPIHADQTNAFNNYVRRYYLDGFGFDPARALLIDPDQIGLGAGETWDSVWIDGRVDLSLRTRPAKTNMERKQKSLIQRVDDFCWRYEEAIQALGGIGFFLGGIGPDGHIAFNIQGSDHRSVTRLTETNFETQAAAATDLGGIAIARTRPVITVGLGTITANPETTAVIIAAGEAKANVVRAAIESPPDLQVPASCLNKLNNARFYLTRGAAKQLMRTRLERNRPDNTHQWLASELCNTSFDTAKPLPSLSESDFEASPRRMWFKNVSQDQRKSEAQTLVQRLQERINQSLIYPKNQVLLHTAPHHDDIMLGYLPYLTQFIHDTRNQHWFNYLTSGFNAVTNQLMEARCDWALEILAEGVPQPDGDGTASARSSEVRGFLAAQSLDDSDTARRFAARRFLSDLRDVFPQSSDHSIREDLERLRGQFRGAIPGTQDPPEIQRLKGMQREWEGDLLWAHFGIQMDHVIHSRLGFYKGEIFTEEPQLNRDVVPVLAMLERIHPTIVTVALDPEGSGPDTHYKVLQAVSAALRIYSKKTQRRDLRVWGYRNVWYRFDPWEADIIAPISRPDMDLTHATFMNAFASQRDAPFPSYAYDGPFSRHARHIQAEQFHQLRTLLGEDFFRQHPVPRVRAAQGFCLLRDMDLDTFFGMSRDLQQAME